jgi:hypothetical protein
MSSPVVRVTLWLAAALHLLAGLYWALLSTPESNAMMLVLSLLLIVVLLLGAGVAVDVAMRLWTGDRVGRRLPDLVLPAVRLLPALAVFGVVWWLAGAADARVEGSRGAITAAIIARTGWADPEAVFTAARWLATLIAWVVGPLAALGLFGALTRGVPVGAVRRWLAPALSWRALAVGALAVIALAWFWPLLEAWRPALPPTPLQLAFVAAKIAAGLTALALAIGSFIRLAALDARPPDPPREPADQRQVA